MYHGDLRLGDTIDIKFCTVQTTGAPFTLAGSPVISAYPANSTTQLTAGITLSVDFDGVTGLNNCRVVATGGNGYAAATNYTLVITTGTVNSVSVVGYTIGSFSIENRPVTVTHINTDVIDAASIAADAEVDVTTIVNTALAAGITTLANSAITSSKIAAAAITEAKFGDDAISRRVLAADTALKPPYAGTAQSATATTIRLASGTTSVDNQIQYWLVQTTGGTGANQVRAIATYAGATRDATVRTWAVIPDATTTYSLVPNDVLSSSIDGIQRSQAFNDFEFVMYDAANPLAAMPGLTVSAQRSIDSGAFAPCTNSPSEVSNGIYVIDLSAADLAGQMITFRFTATGAVTQQISVVTVA